MSLFSHMACSVKRWEARLLAAPGTHFVRACCGQFLGNSWAGLFLKTVHTLHKAYALRYQRARGKLSSGPHEPEKELAGTHSLVLHWLSRLCQYLRGTGSGMLLPVLGFQNLKSEVPFTSSSSRSSNVKCVESLPYSSSSSER